jgi:predicted permease
VGRLGLNSLFPFSREFLIAFLFIFSRVFNSNQVSNSNQIKHVQQFKKYLELHMMQHFMTHIVLTK